MFSPTIRASPLWRHHRMTRTVVGFLGLLVLLPALQAQDKTETPTPAQLYQALDKEYRKATEEYPKALAKAKTREEARKVFEEKFPWPEPFAPRFLELAEKNPKDPAAVDALVWIVTHVNFKNDPKNPRSKAIQILLCDHLQSEKMATLCQSPSIRSALDEDRRHLVSAVLAKSKYRPAQG